MTRCASRQSRGFTLTELAVVLAVVGVLAAGLWQLISGANQQVRDSGAASQQQQLMTAVKAFLGSPAGASFMTTNNGVGCAGNCGPGAVFMLPLPTNCTPATFNAPYIGDLNLAQFCPLLPPGFTTTTTNSYNQFYTIKILRDNTAAGNPPTTYSFMIVTSGGGTQIPDSSGARIASLIGSDGGFIYQNPAGICGVPANHFACGAFGAWGVDLAAFGFGTPYPATGGFVASRTFYSPDSATGDIWLARKQIDAGAPFAHNTMTVPEYMGASALIVGSGVVPIPAASNGNAIYLGGFNAALAGPNAPILTNAMNLQGGTINIQGGTVKGAENTNFSLDLETSLGTLLLSGPGYNSFVYLQTRCSVDATAAANDPTLTASPTCIAGLQDHGDAFFGGRVNVNSLYATTFIYQGSDIRLKKNIKSIENPLDDIMKLKPVSYNLRSTGKEGLGVVAQDLEKVYPQLVSERDDGIKAVNYEGLIAPLIGAVQELKKENDELRQKIVDQDQREKAFEQRLQK